jgi:hypothetical protein
MNLLTPERRKAAAMEIKEGRIFSLSLPLDNPGGNALFHWPAAAQPLPVPAGHPSRRALVLRRTREMAAGYGRWRFMLTTPPLRLPGAVGSPVTPIATV